MIQVDDFTITHSADRQGHLPGSSTSFGEPLREAIPRQRTNGRYRDQRPIVQPRCLPPRTRAAGAAPYEWDKENAARELQPVLAKCWFWEVLQPKLGFRPLDEKEAVNALGAASAASSEYRPNLKLILDYLVTVGMIERDGTMLKLVRGAGGEKPAREEQQGAQQERAARNTGSVTTGFEQRPGGAVQFSINIDVSMTEIAGWAPERISAFFTGMAKVLAAKSGLERDVAE